VVFYYEEITCLKQIGVLGPLEVPDVRAGEKNPCLSAQYRNLYVEVRM